MISLKFKYQVRRWKTAWRFQIFLMATHLCLFIHDILYDHILYELHKKFLRVAQKRSSLIYKASARHERHECDTSNMNVTRRQHEQNECNTSETQATQVWHKCNASATRTTWVQHECYTNNMSAKRVKNFDFNNDTSKSIFSHPYLLYGKWNIIRRGTISF